MRNILDLTYAELETAVTAMGHQAFRARQLWQWLWRRGAREFSAMTSLAREFRERLEEGWSLAWPEVVETRQGSDGTVKLLLRLADGALVETVLIPDKDRYTQCLSCQIGCPMGCAFCGTGQMGFTRNMTGGEIAAQVLAGREHLRRTGLADEVKNLVYMGMGEPLLNWDEVRTSLDILSHPEGLEFSRRRITLSTCAIKDRLGVFGAEGLALPAISLHAPTQEIRERLMPGAARWPIDDLIRALQALELRPRERVTIEYILIRGVNDSARHARQLVRLLSHLKCKVNLIAYNPGPGIAFEAPAPQDVLAFEDILRKKGFTVTLRKSKGQDIAAACGQLKTEVEGRDRAWRGHGERHKDVSMDTPDFEKNGGLVPVIAQDGGSGEVLMLAYMNEDAWNETLRTGEVHYYSRSRGTLWHKGGTSGHVQKVQSIALDCDRDTILVKVEQIGGAACHTGRRSCFYRQRGLDGQWTDCSPMVFDPKEVYK